MPTSFRSTMYSSTLAPPSDSGASHWSCRVSCVRHSTPAGPRGGDGLSANRQKTSDYIFIRISHCSFSFISERFYTKNLADGLPEHMVRGIWCKELLKFSLEYCKRYFKYLCHMGLNWQRPLLLSSSYLAPPPPFFSLWLQGYKAGYTEGRKTESEVENADIPTAFQK